MTWTYTPSAISTTPLYQVRRLIGDVIATEPQIADEEISFALSVRSTIYGAAADCCRYISAQFGRKVDVIVAGAGGNLKQNYSSQATAYLRMAAQFDNLSIARGGALPYAGGISVTDKQNAELDTDRVQPQYDLGMQDNFIPEGPIGNETQTGTGNEGSGSGS
jgi:hypothetical protein